MSHGRVLRLQLYLKAHVLYIILNRGHVPFTPSCRPNPPSSQLIAMPGVGGWEVKGRFTEIQLKLPRSRIFHESSRDLCFTTIMSDGEENY